MPIYWLNGDKAADEYEDFYDETWDEEASMRDESGNTVSAPATVWTGCGHDGTEMFGNLVSLALGNNMGVAYGVPNSDVTNAGPLSSSASGNRTAGRPFYGLSGVFSVSPPGEVLYSATLTVGEDTLLGTYLGYHSGVNQGSLHPVTFTYAGSSVGVFELSYLVGGDLVLDVTTPGASLLGSGSFNLYLDGAAFLIEDPASDSDGEFEFSDHGLSWTNGQIVRVWLTENRPATGVPTITGTPEVRQTLTADISGIMDEDGLPAADQFAYQWISDDSDIDGATDSTYTLVQADAGKTIKVRVSFTDNAKFPESLTSAATTAVTAGETALVSNTGQSNNGYNTITSTTPKRAQAFTTGTNELGYTLSSIGISFGTISSDSNPTSELTATLNKVDGSNPGDVICTLTDPASYVASSVNTYQAPAARCPTLTASTTYFFVISRANDTTSIIQLDRTNSNSEDADPAVGWSIADSRRFFTNDAWTPPGVPSAHRIAVTGAAVLVPPPTEVPSTWSLIPSGLQEGDQFRLLFISSMHRSASPSEIATYNTWVQARAANGHTDIQDYSSSFRAVGSTEDMDARDNTGTTYTSSDKGVAIYWLGGNKVADDYEDFYDEDWDEEAAMKNESGTAETGVSAWTGSDHDGTEMLQGTPETSRALGNSGGNWVRFGKTDSASHGPLSGETAARDGNKRIYGLSSVFEVVAGNNPATGAPTITGTPQVGGVLTADASNIGDPDGLVNVSYSYQWTADDGVTETDIDHATGETYRPITADEDKTVKVRVSFTDDEGNPESLTSAATGAVSPWDKGELIWSALLTVGEYDAGAYIIFGFATGSAGSLEPPTFTFASTDITITTLAYTSPGSSLQLNAATADRQALGSGAFGLYLDEAHWLVNNPAFQPDIPIPLSLRSLSWTDGQEVEVRLTVNHPATGAPVVTGTPEVGETLTADISAIMDEDGLPVLGQLTYQWISNDGTGDSDISGATDSTFTPGGSDEGKSLRVRVSFTDNANFGESLTSDPVDPVGQDDWLWAATMTVGGGGFFLGYEGSTAIGSLTSSSAFAHDSTSYEVEAILRDSTDLTLKIDADLPFDFRLHVGTDQFDKGDAFNVADSGDYSWPHTGLSWSVGDTIPVWLVLVPSGPSVGTVTSGMITKTSAVITVTIANPDTNSQTVNLQYKRNADTAWTDVSPKSTVSAAVTFTLSSLTGNTDYDVRASLDSTFASGVVTATFKTSPVKPAPPTGVAITTEGNGELTVGWTAPTENGGSDITGYKVQWKSGTQSFGTARSTLTADGAATSYTIPSLTNGTEYTVRVLAVNSVGDSDASNTDTGTPSTTPSAPTNVLASGNAELTVTWDAPDDGGSAITGYTVQWKSGTQSYNTTRQATVTTTTHTIPSLTNDTTYTLRVKATNTNGDSDWTEITGTPVSGPGVASVTVDQASITQTLADVTVTMANPQNEVQVVFLRYRVAGDAWPSLANLILSDSGTAITFTLTGLTGNTDYDVAASLDSTFASGVKTASFTTSPTKPGQTTGVSIGIGNGELPMVWTPPLSDGGSAITGYKVQWKSGSQSFGDPSREHTTTGASVTAYIITGLTNGTEYTARVIAVNAVGDGPPSDEKTATPKGPPDAPPNVQAGSGHQQLTVSWGAPNDRGSAITEYRLQWKSPGQSFNSSRQRIIAAPSRTDTIPSLTNGTEYTVRVRATNASGNGPWSAEAKGTPREGPHVSTIRVKEPISCTVTFVALEFVNLEAATEYQAHLRFRAQGSSSWTVLSPRGFWSSGIPSLAAGGALSGPSPAFTLTDLAYETTYEVQAALDSGFVDGLAATTFTTPNLSGAGLTPLSPGDGTLGLRMSRPASEGRVDGYLLQWKSGDEEYDDTDTSERQADVPGPGDLEYTITGLDNGVEYTVRAMAYNDNGVGVPSSEVRGTPEAPPNRPARGAPTISGTAQVGETLTADTDGIEDDDGLADAVYSYQWLADGADISGATGETYTPVADDVGKAIKVKVSFRDDRNHQESLTSAATAAVAEDPDAPTEPPNAPRTVRIVGDTNTSLTLTWDAPDGGTAVTEYRVQWLTVGEGFANARRDGREAVVDASARSHTITGLSEYKFYQVRVLAVNGAGESERSNTAWGFPGLGEGQYGHG